MTETYLQLLTSGQKKIGFVGSSVTVMKEGYRHFLMEFFKKNFNQNAPTEVLAALGGVGVDTASFLVLDQFSKNQNYPDVCFIEYSVNDHLENGNRRGWDLESYLIRLRRALEELVFELETRGVKIFFLHMYQKVHRPELYYEKPTLMDRRLEKYYPQGLTERNYVIHEYDRIAEKFNIPSINVDQIFFEDIKLGKYTESDLLLDTVHPTRLGAELAAQLILEKLKSLIITKEELLIQPPSTKFKILPLEEKHILGALPKKKSLRNTLLSCDYYEIEEGGTFKIEFSTPLCICGFFLVSGPRAGWIEFQNGTQNHKLNTHTIYSYADRFTAFPLKITVDPRFPVLIQGLPLAVDYSAAIEHFEKKANHDKAYLVSGFQALMKVKESKCSRSLSIFALMLEAPRNGSD